MKKLKLISMFIPLFLLTGCWNSKQIEHTTYLQAIGVDYVNGKYIVYTNVLDLSLIAKKEASGGKAEKETIWVGKGMGDNLDLALHNIYSTSQERISWGQIQAILFRESVIKHGLNKGVLDVLNRYFEFRQTIWVYGTKVPIQKIFNTHPISFASSLYNRFSDPEGIYKQNSYIEPLRLNRFLARFYEPGQTTLLPVLTVSKERWKENNKPNPLIKRDGIFLLHQQKLMGFLPESNLDGIRWMQKKTVRTPLPIVSDKGEPVGAVVMERPKADIIPKVKNGKAMFDIKVKVYGTVMEMKNAMSEDYIEKQVTKLIKKQIIKAYKDGLKQKADVLQLSEALYRDQPQVWHQLTTKGEIPLFTDSLDSVQVSAKIKTTGRSVLD